MELSSFQLELIDTFRPNIGLFLNLTPDHLDRHHTLKEYGDAKARIFENQTADDLAIPNADDAATAAVAYAPAGLKAEVVLFTSCGQRVGLWSVSARRRGRAAARRQRSRRSVSRRNSSGGCSQPREWPVGCRCRLTKLAGATVPAIAAGIRSFAGVEHRLEFVAEIGGVRYYNDSKATNVDATLKALEAFPGRILIVLGGKDKDSDYTVLQQPLREKAILALLIGAASEKIEKQIAGSVAIERAGTLERAIEIASHAAHSGDIVLLAPACSSFDQFENYEHRGRVFKSLVQQLQTKALPVASGSNRRSI